MHAAQSIRGIGKGGNVRHIKEAPPFNRHAIADRGRAEGMLHRDGLELQSANFHNASQRHPAPVGNGITAEKIQRFLWRISSAGSAFGKSCSVIRVGMGKQDRCGSYTLESA